MFPHGEITFILRNGSGLNSFLGPAYLALLEKGVAAVAINDERREIKTKSVACWGWRKGQPLKRRGHNVLLFERGYLGDRFKWTSIGWNGLNGRASFCWPENPDPARFYDNFTMQPWRDSGDYIVIFGQVAGDMSLGGLNMSHRYEEWAEKLKKIYGKPVYFRPHPAGGEHKNFNPHLPKIGGDLQSCLAGAFLTVSYNSNAGVDSVLAGVPHICVDRDGSMAAPVCGVGFENRMMPDREKWAIMLAHSQYTLDEIGSGAFWERLSGFHRQT